MATFGELKNSVQRLQLLNRSMGIVAKIKCSKNAVTQKEIKNQPISFYLQILHFAFTEYSPQLYKLILDTSPNFKTMPDYKFVQTCFTIARNVFNYKSQITVEQFLQQGKLIQKRLKWVVDVVEQLYKWQNKSKPKASKQSKINHNTKDSTSYYQPVEDIDEEELRQRQIKIKPTQFDFQATFLPKNKASSSRQNQLKSQMMNANTFKGNVFPKNILQPSYLSDEEEQVDNRQVVQKKKVAKPLVRQNSKEQLRNRIDNKAYQQVEQHEENEYVSRVQYNQLLAMISTLNGSINNLISKFNNFQGFVGAELTKITARVSLVQQNVKVIKANI